MQSIAFIGSVGIPNCYGGFESFLESVTPVMARAGNEVYVTCDYNRYEDRTPVLWGVNRLFIKMPANGALSPLHDLMAFFATVRKVDAVCVLGVSAGPFFLIMRLVSALLGKQLLVNVDGVEWRRSKYTKKVRFVLRAFDFMAQLAATKIIYDNVALREFVSKMFRSKAVCIPYSGDHVLRLPEHDKGNQLTALTVCRIEPENNLELLMDGALQSGIEKYVIIGNWNASAYGIKLREKYQASPKLELLDPIYERQKIAERRESCTIYLHGHSVGGTNPSLVEMLFYDCAVLCFDCSFNRETAGERAGYCSSPAEFAARIDAILAAQKNKAGAAPSYAYPERYTAAYIAQEYLDAAAVDADVGNRASDTVR